MCILNISLLQLGVHSDLLQLFQSSLSLSSSSSLSFSNIGLQSKHCLPLFHTLMAYPSLTSLCFTGVFLTDSSLHHLGSLLSSLPTLCHLDLSCTGISGAGLQSIVQALTTPTSESYQVALNVKLLIGCIFCYYVYKFYNCY